MGKEAQITTFKKGFRKESGPQIRSVAASDSTIIDCSKWVHDSNCNKFNECQRGFAHEPAEKIPVVGEEQLQHQLHKIMTCKRESVLGLQFDTGNISYHLPLNCHQIGYGYWIKTSALLSIVDKSFCPHAFNFSFTYQIIIHFLHCTGTNKI